MVWLVLAVLSALVVFVGLALEFVGGRLVVAVGQFCSVCGGTGFTVGVTGFILSLFIHIQQETVCLGWCG